MKRDMDLCREILLAVEAREHWVAREFLQEDFPDRDMEAVGCNTWLLINAGLLADGEAEGSYVRVRSLTWAGCEFLDAARNKNVWEEAKGAVAETAQSVGFEVLKDTLTTLGKRAVFSALGLPF